jgi:hypothetical protein
LKTLQRISAIGLDSAEAPVGVTASGLHCDDNGLVCVVESQSLVAQLVWLVILAGVVACVSWTVTHERVFEEPRTYCEQRSRTAQRWYVRKWFYLFTCEYCFSHYVSAAVVIVTPFHLLLPGWRGLVIAWFSCVWVANIYMSLFGRLRLDIKRERVEIAEVQGQPANEGETR